jgi:hypothetical protein
MSEDAQAASDSNKSQYKTEVMRAYTDTGTLDGILDFASMDADGFTLTVDDQFTQAYRISYLALGGTDLTNVYIGSKQQGATTGNYSVTGVGFQPDALIIASFVATAEEAAVAQLSLTIGMATGSSNQGVVSGLSEDNAATSNTFGYGYDGEVFTNLTTTGTLTKRDTFVSFDSDGFTLNTLEGTGRFWYFFIALKGGQYKVGQLTTRTDGNDIAETEPGFQPVAILFASANRALSTQDSSSAHLSISIGAATSTSNRATQAVWDEDNLADSETSNANYDSAVYAFVKDDAIQALMDIKSIDATGFTAVMDDTEPSAGAWVTYLAIGAAATTSVVPVLTSQYRRRIT